MPGSLHIKKVYKSFQGNLAFSSKNAFNQISLSRRDDLISLVYLLMYLATGKLPFVKHDLPLMEQINRIKRKKNKYSPQKFCTALKCAYFTEFAKEIYALGFEDEPDYSHLRFILQKNLMDKNDYPNRVFDWTVKIEKGSLNKFKDQYLKIFG